MKLRLGINCVLPVLLLLVSTRAGCQEVAVKTNLFSDAFANINVGAEAALAPKWTLDLEGELNTWTLSHGRRWKHWALQPEARYWLCDRFGGHFLGVHIHTGQFNMGGFDGILNFLGTDARKLKDSRYQGWFVGAGVAYGYDWILSRHLNLEAEIGIGYSYTHFDRFDCAGCGKKAEAGKSHNYVGPTRAAVNLVYLF
ncbi:MAG: DUF3575 domain-containing protein [Prevotellaceae bacterium]|nr:DUF3575 domain-containing protein [Prevotellaceae bacterium]